MYDCGQNELKKTSSMIHERIKIILDDRNDKI